MQRVPASVSDNTRNKRYILHSTPLVCKPTNHLGY